MSAAAMVSFRAPVLPWSLAADDQVRLRRVSRTVLGTCAAVCVLLLWLPVVKDDRTQPRELPPRLAKLLLERPPAPPPAAVKPPVTVPARAVEQPSVAAPPAKAEGRRPEPPASSRRLCRTIRAGPRWRPAPACRLPAPTGTSASNP